MHPWGLINYCRVDIEASLFPRLVVFGDTNQKASVSRKMRGYFSVIQKPKVRRGNIFLEVIYF